MRMRRIVDHIRSLHWTLIGVDFVIVVIGVFVGMQVTNWNESRNLEHRKATALGRMHDESEANIAYLAERSELLARDAPLRTEALRRLATADWQGADVEKIGGALDTLGWAPAVSPPRGVYDELISTGMFAELGDARLRDAISSYYAYITFVGHQLEYFRDDMIARSAGRLFAGKRVVFDPSTERQVRTIYDLPALSADPQFVQTALLDNVSLIAQAQWTSKALARAKAMCVELARVDGRACDMARPATP